MINNDDQIVERAPTLDEYRTLCTAVGWEHAINFDTAPASLARSLFHTLAVHPAHQGRGIGRLITAQLMGYLKTHTLDKAFLGLFAAEGSQSLHRSFGFAEYDQLTGMFRVTPVE